MIAVPLERRERDFVFYYLTVAVKRAVDAIFNRYVFFYPF